MYNNGWVVVCGAPLGASSTFVIEQTRAETINQIINKIFNG